MDFKAIITANLKTKQSKIILNLLSEIGYRDIKDFQTKQGLTVDGVFGQISFSRLYDVLLKPKYQLGFYDFFREKFNKRQIVWHHTEGYDNAEGVIDWWTRDGKSNISTSIVINKNGELFQAFDPDYWSYSLGIKGNRYLNGYSEADKFSIGVELTNAGGLIKNQKEQFVSAFNSIIPKENVEIVDFRNFLYFDKYPEKQLKTLKYFTLICAAVWDIPLNYDFEQYFKLNTRSLSGQKGIYTHCSFRDIDEKQDLSPQKDLINMSKSLIDYIK
jgi:peptidoglycan hydrolase-like protein with peptidoglycan-binding domain